MCWQKRTDLNWCPCCWFEGKFESKDRVIGKLILCLNCGTSFNENDETIPKYFDDETWDKYWEQNFKL